MDEASPDALADVAYGLFEHHLHARMHDSGNPLFALVEGGVDFHEDFLRIFQDFSTEYPQLSDALLCRFGSADVIYARVAGGEGVVPSRTTLMYWIIQDAPGVRPDAIEDEIAGKWLIFLPKEEADAAWRRVRDATCRGELGISAKASTARENPDARDARTVIYVYTSDWRDEGDVMRVRERLRGLGFTDRIGYKRNLETFRGEYSEKGKRVTFYSA